MNLIYLFIFVFGLLIGSFLNCFIWRIYKEETILGRSYCPKCKKQLKWFENIPVFSFIFLKGRCSSCRKKISWQYPVVELLTGFLFLLAFHFSLDSEFFILSLFFKLFFVSLMVIIFVFDLRWFLIPVQVLIFSSIIFFFLNLYFGFSLWQILLSTLIGASFFGIQYVLTRGRGLGEGDIWLGAFLGLAFPSLANLTLLLFLTYLIGGLVAIFLIIFGFKKIGSKIPLGIFLSTAAIITLFWSDRIISWYLSLILG